MSLVTITNSKDNTLEFELSVDGISANDAKVRFVVQTSEMSMVFDAHKESGETWSVKIPQLSTLSKTAYNYKIEVVIDGYFFEPITGVLNVVGSHELYASTPKNVTLKPKEEKAEEKPKVEEKKPETTEKPVVKKVEEKVVPKKNEPKKPLLKTLAAITESASTTEPPATVEPEKPAADDVVKNILKEAKKPKKVMTSPAFKKIDKLH